MPFRSITLQPGVNIEATPTLNQVNLADSLLVRFYGGLVQKLGGWLHQNVTPLIGTCRGMWAWADQNQNIYTACGTEQRLQVLESGGIYDITPVVQTDNVPVSFSTTAESPSVTITDPDYLPDVGDWMYLATQVMVGGIVLFGYYQVTGVSGGTTYTVNAASDATYAVVDGGATPEFFTTDGEQTVSVTIDNHGLATGDTINFVVPTTVGGITISGTYIVTVTGIDNFTISVAAPATSTASASMNNDEAQIQYLLPSGYAVNTRLTGYGIGEYGMGAYGEAGQDSITGYLRQWSFGNWGLSLIASPFQGAIYYWTPPEVSPAIPLATVLDPPATPTLSYVAGGSIGATTYYVKTTYTQSNGGESTPSEEASLAVPADNLLVVASPSQPGSANGWNAYVATSTGEETLQNSVINEIGTAWKEPTSGLVSGVSPPSSNTTSGSPLYSNFIFIIPQAQIIVALGAESGGTQNNLLVRWCDAGDFTDWVASATNQAGSYLFSSGTTIISGTPVGLGALIWTDVDVWYMQYIGYPLVFSFTQLAGSCGIMGARCGADTAGFVIWLSTRGFYTYQAGGGVDAMECPVWDFIFDNIDLTQQNQCHMAVNSLFDEMAWHFPVSPSSPIYNASAPMAYVKYNFVENAWDKGYSPQYQRTAWIEKNPQSYPAGTDFNGLIQEHEISNDADGAAMVWSFQTGYFDLMDGEEFVFVDLIIPDFNVSFTGSVSPIIQVTLLCTDYPIGLVNGSVVGEPLMDGPYYINTAQPGATLMVPVRMRARQIALLFEGADLGSFFRIGKVRVRFSPDGRGAA